MRPSALRWIGPIPWTPAGSGGVNSAHSHAAGAELADDLVGAGPSAGAPVAHRAPAGASRESWLVQSVMNSIWRGAFASGTRTTSSRLPSAVTS